MTGQLARKPASEGIQINRATIGFFFGLEDTLNLRKGRIIHSDGKTQIRSDTVERAIHKEAQRPGQPIAPVNSVAMISPGSIVKDFEGYAKFRQIVTQIPQGVKTIAIAGVIIELCVIDEYDNVPYLLNSGDGIRNRSHVPKVHVGGLVAEVAGERDLLIELLDQTAERSPVAGVGAGHRLVDLGDHHLADPIRPFHRLEVMLLDRSFKPVDLLERDLAPAEDTAFRLAVVGSRLLLEEAQVDVPVVGVLMPSEKSWVSGEGSARFGLVLKRLNFPHSLNR